MITSDNSFASWKISKKKLDGRFGFTKLAVFFYAPKLQNGQE